MSAESPSHRAMLFIQAAENLPWPGIANHDRYIDTMRWLCSTAREMMEMEERSKKALVKDMVARFKDVRETFNILVSTSGDAGVKNLAEESMGWVDRSLARLKEEGPA